MADASDARESDAVPVTHPAPAETSPHDATDVSGAEPELDALLTDTLEHLQQVLPITGSTLELVDGDDLVVRAASGPSAARALGRRTARRFGGGWRVLDKGKFVLSGDSTPGSSPTSTPVPSGLAVPIAWRGERIGVLEVESTEPAAFDEAAVRLLEGAARTLGGWIRLAEGHGNEARCAAEHREQLADLRREVEQLRTAERAREEFLAVVTHDLRTPLTSVRALAQLGHRAARRLATPEGDKIARWLDGVIASSGRMTKLITELLDVGRLHAGRPLDLELAKVDLVDLVRGVVAEHAATTRKHTLSLETDLPTLVGRWDAARLERAVANLLSNAVKYSPDGGCVVVRIASQEGRAELSVSDEGIGVPSADLPRIFDRFHRGSNTVGVVPGTGIGLASVKQIVERHGGRVSVTSHEGHGSTFRVELPTAVSAE